MSSVPPAPEKNSPRLARAGAHDPLVHVPIFSFFMFLLASETITPPRSPALLLMWRYKATVWLILLAAVLSGVFLFSIGSVNSILIPPLLFNYALAPSTFSVIRGIAPLWISLYKPEATKLFRDFKLRVHRFIFTFIVICSLILIVSLAVWAWYVYNYVVLAPPIDSARAFFSAASSAMFGFYVVFSCLGITMTVIAQVIVCIMHELQLELLLSAIRKRSRDFRLATIVPSKFARPSLLQRLARLFRDPMAEQEIRPNPAAHSPAANFDRPLSNIFDMIKNVQDTFDWTAYKFLPLFLVNNYALVLLNLLFLALAIGWEIYFGLAYMAIVAVGIPVGLCCNAILNSACEDFEKRLEQCLSMYTSEEQAQILAAVRTRPLKYVLGGVHITWKTIIVAAHLLLIPPVIALFFWVRSEKPFV